MERYFFRSHGEREKKERQEPLHLAVTGLGQSVGTTFVATALAFCFRDMGKTVSYTECLTPKTCDTLYFDAVAMDKRFAHRIFHDFYQLIIDGEPLKQRRNLEAGINWILPTPQNCANQVELDDRQRARLVAAAKEEVCIFDFEADYGWDSFLLDMDIIFVVVDPLPSKLIRSKERFKLLKKMELSGCKVIWIVNKVNRGVHKRQVKAYLKTDKIFWLESFDADVVYLDEYACKFHWEDEEIKRKMLEIFTKVSPF